MSSFTNKAWQTWTETNANDLHLQIARLVVARDSSSYGQPLRLSLAPLSKTVPGPQIDSPCDLLVLFVAVEDWLYVLQPTVSKVVRKALALVDDDIVDRLPTTAEEEPSLKKQRKA